MKVLALDGDSNTCVTCVRSLARAGHRVVVGAPNRHSKAGWSRFCSATFQYPSPEHEVQGFVKAVVAEAAKEPGTLVLPLTEPTSLAISEYRERILEAGGRLVLPAHDALLKAHDKVCSIELARSSGFAIPRSMLVRSDQDPRPFAASVGYPLALKARTSEETIGGKMTVSPPPQYARDERDLMAAWNHMRERCSSVLLQEYIEGRGAGYFAVMSHGELRAEFAHSRLREVRPTGSGSCLRVSVKPDPRVREASLRMLRELNYHGAVMIEFRVRRDGTPVFMEINPRICNSVALAVYSGLNIPLLVAGLAEHDDIAPEWSYKTGVRCRWIVGDLRHLLSVLRGRPARFPGRFPSRLQALLDVLLPVPGTRHDPFEWHDPLPEVGDWLHSLQRFIGRATKPARPVTRRRAAASS